MPLLIQFVLIVCPVVTMTLDTPIISISRQLVRCWATIRSSTLSRCLVPVRCPPTTNSASARQEGEGCVVWHRYMYGHDRMAESGLMGILNALTSMRDDRISRFDTLGCVPMKVSQASISVSPQHYVIN